MVDFIKLTRVTGWKVGEDKKRVATETKPVYIRPSEIISFADDDGYTYIALSHDESLTVTEKADDIYNLVSRKKDDGYKRYTPYFRDGIDGNKIFLDDDFWWANPIKAEWTSKDAFDVLNKTPYYTTTIIYTNGDIWE
jgi:hypothetical protein